MIDDLKSEPGTIDAVIAACINRETEAALEPLRARLREPEPLVWTVPQVAKVLQVSVWTVGQMLDTGVLPELESAGRRRLVPRVAVERLVAAAVDGTD